MIVLKPIGVFTLLFTLLVGCDTSDPTGGGTGITQAELDALACAFGCSVVAISVGPPRNGSLSDDDCSHPNPGDQSKIDYFGFRLSQNMSIVIDYESSDYDALLVPVRLEWPAACI